MHKYNVLAHVEIKDGIGVVKRTGYSPLLKGNFTSEEIFNMLSNRCFPKESSNCKEILRNLGLEEYDIYSIIRKTRGIMFNDFEWIRFKDDLDFNPIEYRRAMGAYTWED